MPKEEYMGLFSSHALNTLDDLFVVQLEELYDAERRLTKALARMAEASSSNALRSAFKDHLGQTKQHVAGLEEIFGLLGLSPRTLTCDPMTALIDEGAEAIDADGESDVKDAALIAAAQRIEHYEIAGYGSLSALARQLGHEEIARRLHQTLEEENAANTILSQIAESSMNVGAAGA